MEEGNELLKRLKEGELCPCSPPAAGLDKLLETFYPDLR
jgi:hypothetical protein